MADRAKRAAALGITAVLCATCSISVAQTYLPPDVDVPSLRPTPCDGLCPLPIERAMREFQGRSEFFGEGDAPWPRTERSCPENGDGTDAPPYPPDGFYDRERCDAWKAAALVQNLLDKMNDADWMWYFVDYEGHGLDDPLDGQALPDDLTNPNGPDGWLARALAPFDPNELVTPENYCEVLEKLDELLRQLKDVQLPPGWFAPGDGSGDDIMSSGDGVGCEGLFRATRPEAYNDCTEVFQMNPPTPSTFQGVLKHEQITWEGGPPGDWGIVAVWRGSGGGELSSHYSSLRGRLTELVSVATYEDGPGANELPVDEVGMAFEWGVAPLPAHWKRGFGRTPLKILTVEDTGGGTYAPDGDRGWHATRRWTVIRPAFNTAPDTAALPGRGGCQGCGPGHVTYSRTDLSVKISLGLWDRGSAGYLLIRGDTLVGDGQEILHRVQPHGMPVVGGGASELGDPKSLVVCADPIIRPHLSDPSSGYSTWSIGRDLFGVANERDQDNHYRHLKQLRFPQGVVQITPLTGTSYQLTFYRNPGAYSQSTGLYDLSTAVIAKVITVSHHMEPLADDPDSADDRDLVVTGVLEIYDSSTSNTTRYKQTKKVRDWTVEVDDPKNYTEDGEGNPEHEQIAEGFLPGTGPWYDSSSRSGTWRVDAVLGQSGPPIDLASVESSRGPGEGQGTIVETRVSRDPNGVILKKDRLKSLSVSGAEFPVERVVDPDGAALTTSWGYLFGSDGTARLLQSTQPSGVTQSFQYDSAGRLTQIASPLYTNQSNEPPATRVESFSYLYVDLPNDANWGTPPFDGADRELITTKSRSEAGHEVQRSYTVTWSAPPDDRPQFLETSTIEVTDLEPISDVAGFVAQVMADPMASGHRVTHSASYFDPYEGSNHQVGYLHFNGRPKFAWSSDGNAAITDYQTWASPPYPNHFGLERTVRAGPRATTSPASPVNQMPVLADGTRTVTMFDHVGNTKLSQTFDMQGTTGDDGNDDDILISEREITGWEFVTGGMVENPGRPTQISYSDGTSEETAYDCCTVLSRRDRDGVLTSYNFDDRHRLVTEISASDSPMPVRTTYTYDALDRTRTTSRGPSGNSILQTQNTYDVAGRLVATTDALGAQTEYEEGINNEIGIISTVTLPDPDGAGPLLSPTQITSSTSDGWQIESGGTAAHPVRYERGVELDATISASTWVTWQKEIRLGSQSETTEWVKQYTDPLGRNYKTVYADGATERSYYDARGHLVKQVDADGVVMLSRQGQGFESGLPGSAADWDGDWQVSCVDMDQDGVIDFNGTDRISRSVSKVLHSTDHGGGDFRRTTSSILTTDNNATSWLVIGQQDERVGEQNATTTGLQSWQTAFGQTVATVALVDRGNQKRTVRTTSPAGTVSESVNQYGRSAAARTFFVGGALHTESTTAYDVHGRVASTTDTRGTQDTSDDRSVTYTYDNKDRVTAVTMTPAQTGGSPVVTSSTYDALDRVLTSTAPDGAVQHFEYLPTGQVKKAWGGRSYPVEYTYDSQGRSKTLTTWQSFNFGTGQGTSGAATTTWTYSPTRGWLTTKGYQGQAGPTYGYWPSGRMKSRSWARGITTNYTYTTGGELHQINYSDTTPDVTHTYNRRGQVVAVTDGVGDRTLAYSDPGAMIDEDFTSGVLDPVHIQNTYDSLLRRDHNKLQVNSIQVNDVSYGYDAASSRLASVGKDSNHRAEYAYTPGDDSLASTTFKVSNVTKATVTRTFDKLGRLTQIQSDSVTAPDEGFTYTYDAANQRTRVDLVDGTYWLYQYDSLGQVIGGKRYIDLPPAGPDGDILTPGEQFEYTFDHIGNRTQTKVGGNSAGQSLRTATYNRNLLNQYTSRTVPGTVDLLGFAPANNPVTFATPPGGNPVAADFRSGEFYQKALSWTNTLIARYEGVDIDTNGGGAPEETRWVFLPKTPENFTHDLDGNLLSDGKWLYTWDGENRLVAMETKSSLPVAMPAVRLEFVYDYMSRRCVKRVYDHSAQGGTPSSGEPTVEGSASAVVQGGQPGSPEGGVIITPPGWTLVSTYKFVWDGWLLIGELDGQNAVVRTCAWGLDVSGSPGGAGGVGGLAFESLAETGATHFAFYDGNGNLTSLRDDTGAISAAYEYGPFGETLTTRGNVSALSSNTFKFSTKYTDAESGLLYFGHRYYNQGTGRWLSRDPLEEDSSHAVFAFVNNKPLMLLDAIGLWATDVHHLMVEQWLNGLPGSSGYLPEYRFIDYHKFVWHCMEIDVIQAIQDGSDQTDGAGHYFEDFVSAQSSKSSYQHAMRPLTDTVSETKFKYDRFVGRHRLEALDLKNAANREFAKGNRDEAVGLVTEALMKVGVAFHAYSDSLSPSHSGFQLWLGPVDGPILLGTVGYAQYVAAHKAGEAMAIYQKIENQLVHKVRAELQNDVDSVLDQR